MTSEHEAATAAAAQLAEAAASLRATLTEPHAADILPPALSHVGDAIDELAGGMLVLAETIASSSGLADVSADLDHLDPEARALCWHLHELAARLRAARASTETALDWAQSRAARRPRELAGAGARPVPSSSP